VSRTRLRQPKGRAEIIPVSPPFRYLCHTLFDTGENERGEGKGRRGKDQRNGGEERSKREGEKENQDRS
jgi:hypothetical protein